MLNLTQKIIKEHLVEGELRPGEGIGIGIDQTLTQDATGTLTYLQFEALALPCVKTKLSVSYVDHNTLQTGFENADDHRYLQSVAAKYGIYFSKPGNGICHQVHLERFAVPGETLLGSDSHTPNAGALGMLAVGAGGLDVAMVMAGMPFYLEMPKVLGVKLKGKLAPWVAAKDVILELLHRMGVSGGVSKIIEYYGEGVASLSVTQRATITNMGAELGATSSIFPSDAQTKEYLKRQGRADVWKQLEADNDAEYDEMLEIDLSSLEPMIALPSSPGNVRKVSEVEGLKVHQVLVGSCNNSSCSDLMMTAAVLKDRKIHPDVSFAVSPGSRQVLLDIASNNSLSAMVKAGARILESACDGCIGMGQAPPTDVVSLRTYNRNFSGRSGTKDDKVYLCSPEVAIASAVNGVLTDPRKLGDAPKIELPERFDIDDSMILPPVEKPDEVGIIKGPNIKPLPLRGPLVDVLVGEVLLKVGDNVTTDAIMPAGAKVLPLRSNIPAISEYAFSNVAPDFVRRAKEKKGGFIVGGINYGQGSSREHAAVALMYLGVKAVLAKSFARIHRANLINFGIVPLEFANADDYEQVMAGDTIEMGIKNAIGSGRISIFNKTNKINASCDLSPREAKVLLAGGLLNYTKGLSR
ncbi:MAG: aconitate hydratase [Candidatus Hydrothermarchaeales archaeon]